MTTEEARRVCALCGKSVMPKRDGTPRHHTNGIPDWPGAPFSQVCRSTTFRPAAPNGEGK